MRGHHLSEAVFGEAPRRPRESSASRLRSFSPTRGGRVLLVEPDEASRAHLREVLRDVADIDGDADFLTARTHLFSHCYDWLVTNTRLGIYNGLHLVYLADASQLPIRSLVYADRHDVWLAREAQQVGAFYESRDRVDRALPAYLLATLPPQDRRDPAKSDRRTPFRGGRRCAESTSGTPTPPTVLEVS